MTKLTVGGAHAAMIIIDVPAAPSAEVAKKCAALTAKAFPPRVAGNPATGSATGTGQSGFFNDCVAKGGNVVVPAVSVPIPPERPH